MDRDNENASEEEETNREDRVDVLISLVIAIAAAFFLLTSQEYAGVSSNSADPGAALWPQIVLVVLLLSSIINMIKIYRRNNAVLDLSGYADPITSVETDEGLSSVEPETRQYVASIVLVAAYLFVFNDVGFLVSTIVFLALFVWILGYRSVPKTIAFSVVVSVIIFIVFRNFMNIALPYGTSVFREIGIFFEGLI